MDNTIGTSLTSGGTRFAGLGSGTDFDSMVTKLIDIERTKTKQLLRWRSQWENKSAAFDELSAAMLKLNSSLQTMNTTEEFLIKSAATSNPQALTASANSQAELGTHDISVISLATTDMHMGTEIFSAADDVVGQGTFSFVYGNRQMSIDTTSTTTLNQFAKLINNDSQNPGLVKASVINDGSGYRLQIRGMELGAGRDFLVDDSKTTLTHFSAADFTQTQNAQNAQLRVDGWPTDPPTAISEELKATLTGKTSVDVAAATDATFQFLYSGQLHTVAVTAGSSYTDLVNSINADVGFTLASATDTGNGLEFSLTGQPGSQHQITVVNTPGTTIIELQSTAFVQERGATDGYIERSSNAISNVVQGLTMNLLKAGETTTLGTALDNEAVTEKVRGFVDEVNSVFTVIRGQTKVETVGEKSSGSILTGNYGVQMIQQKLKNILAERGIGFDYDSDPLISLGSVGITTDTREGSPTFGMLVFDEGAFSQALQTDPEATARLFSADMYPSTKEIIDGEAVESPNFRYESLIRGVTKPGNYSISYTVAGGAIAASPPPTINGYTASISGNKLIAVDADNPARGLGMEVINLTDGVYSGQVQIKSGKTEELSEELQKLTDRDSGTLNILKDNYQDIMDSIDKKIVYEQRRLSLLEKTLRLKFARLDSVLGTYDKISKQLESQIKGLSSK